jgi:glycerate kinase
MTRSDIKIVVAPDSFKGTLTAREAAAAMADGIRRALPGARIVEMPMADGGEGTLDAILSATSGTLHALEVRGPLGDPVRARYGMVESGLCAVVEMAQASGLLLTPPDGRDVLRASTYGTGQLMRDALDRGASRVLVTVGGSATCDGGCGMAQALGVRFFSHDGSLLPNGMGGGDIARVHRIDVDAVPRLCREARVEVLCDVSNPLIGAHGAAHVYAPQKGATPREVALLEKNLTHLATLVRRDIGLSVERIPGGGAAGGLAAGLVAFANGRIRSGIEAVIELSRLAEQCNGAAAILAGEGRFDDQSLQGKVVSGLSRLGRELGIPVYVLAGQVVLERGRWSDSFADVAAVSTGEAADNPSDALAAAAARAAAVWFASL